jgi:3-hydroxybutyryl-CoA dehydrogenase
MSEVRKVGVVGAGVMGVGVGQALALTGHEAVLVDLSQEILDRAREEIRKNLRFQGMLEAAQRAAQKGAQKEGQGEVQREPTSAVLARLSFTTELAALGDADLVVENVPEKWAIKSEVYPKLDAIAPERAIFAVDTSCFSITRVAALTKRPDRVIGIHFMNPVPLKPMVEVIRGYHTSEETIERTRAFLRRMGKESVVVNDLPGFVTNRVLMLTVNEAIFLVQDGVADAEQIDLLFRGCFGHKMGPLETADLIGLDTILYSLEVLYESYSDSKYRPSPLLRKMVDAGLLGRKSGKGFHDYNAV